MKMIWWIPLEFWDVVANENSSIKRSDMDEVKEKFSEYTMIIAIDGTKDDGPGVYKYQTYEEVKSHIKVMDSLNVLYTALNDDEIDNTALLFREKLKPILSNMLGAMGRGANLYFFKTPAGVNTTKASVKGRFKVILDNVPFKWTMPLACLMPPRFCPIDDLKMKGDWIYCPYHGVKL